MTRFRYFKTGETTIASHPFLINTQLAFVVLHTDTLEFQIILREDGTLIVSGYANTLAALKKEAKDTAIAFGARIEKEIRKQTKLNLDNL